MAEQTTYTTEQIMEQAQVFASAWSMVGGPFDSGDGLERAEQEKAELRAMVAAHAAPAPQEPAAWRISDPSEPDIGHWLSEEPGTSWQRSEPLYTAPPAAEQQSSTARLLAVDHSGMRICAHGTLGRIADGRYHSGLRFGCGEMLRHLEQMAARFYAGDPTAVDEFLQLYCLDEHRPKLKAKEVGHA